MVLGRVFVGRVKARKHKMKPAEGEWKQIDKWRKLIGRETHLGESEKNRFGKKKKMEQVDRGRQVDRWEPMDICEWVDRWRDMNE
jgi:hypothetical protein